MPARLVGATDRLQHPLVLPVDVDTECVFAVDARWVHVVDEDWRQQDEVVPENMRVPWGAGRECPKRIDSLLRVVLAVPTHGEHELAPEGLVPLRQPWENFTLEEVGSIPVPFSYVVRDVENCQSGADQNGSDDDAFWLDAMGPPHNFVEIVEPVGFVTVSGDDALVLHADSRSPSIVLTAWAWFANEEVYPSPASPRSGYVVPACNAA